MEMGEKLHAEAVPYITFDNLDKIPFIQHGFSTRGGGVSSGIYESMNLSFTRGDDEGLVKKNFELIGEALNIPAKAMVYAMQTHTVNVLKADECHRGMGVTRERNYSDIDGLITNRPGVCLVTSYADCVPIFLVDTVKQAIGLSHSGWRGTIGNISAETIKKMNAEYGTDAVDIQAVIGPSICRDCYEVSADVAEQFIMQYGDAVARKLADNKYLLDLQYANRRNLLQAGVPDENIYTSRYCTCCNPKLFFSHRASKGQRGGMCGFLMIKQR